MGQADLKKENDDAFLSPEVDVNIANLVNEINDFAVGILRAEMRAVEERVECKRLLQQVHSGFSALNLHRDFSPDHGELAFPIW
jgi:hypothetical protein